MTDWNVEKAKKHVLKIFGISKFIPTPNLAPVTNKFVRSLYTAILENSIKAKTMVENASIQTSPPNTENGTTFLESVMKESIMALKFHTRQIDLSFPSGRQCRIIISVPTPASSTRETKIKYKIYKICLWLYILDGFAPPNSSKNLTIYLLLTPLLKLLPQVPKDEIGQLHANTAFTYSCRETNKIVIFRHEEWFKVFIHETMHAFCMDFSSTHGTDIIDDVDTKIKSVFIGIGSKTKELRVYECYTETWANIIHVVFISFFKSKSKYFNEGIFYEMCWSTIQCHKVLNHYGIKYNDLFEKSGIYNETMTHTFAYHVLKMICIVYLDQFIAWCFQKTNQTNYRCIQFNQTDANMMDFAKFLCIRSKEPSLYKWLSCANMIHCKEPIKWTLRMTLHEDRDRDDEIHYR
jgi:hypothetical protein